MRSIRLLILFSLILIIGCATAKQKYQTYYDPEYKVTDRGALDVKLTSQACSVIFEDALSAAKKNAKFRLRSVVGSKNHGIKFKEVGRYIKNNKICVKVIVSSLPP